MRALALLLAASPALAQDAAEDRFVSDNLIAIFYHELGHALIDTLALPIFGQEEIAADVASVVLIADQFDDESLVSMAYSVPAGFEIDAYEEGADPAFWDVHGAAEQRYYTAVCLFHGALPEGVDYAAEMGLPRMRAETCAEEFDLAAASWGPVLADLAETKRGALSLIDRPDGLTGRLIAEEIAALNDAFGWPDIEIAVRDCGEANAFYTPGDRLVEICTEFENALRTGWRSVLAEPTDP